MARILVPDAQGHRHYRRVVLRIAPAAEVVPTHPQDIVVVSVAVPQVLAESTAFGRAILEHELQVIDGLARIQNHQQTVFCRQADHPIAAGKIGLVGGREVVGRVKRPNSIMSAAILPAPVPGRHRRLIQTVLNPCDFRLA
jgi:hypothetical protein